VEQAQRANLSDDHRGPIVRDIGFTGAAAGQLLANDIIIEAGAPAPRRRVRTVAELDRVIESARPGSVVSLLIYRPQFDQTAVVNLRVGG
jgi:hypothetical protein